jgi:hypothetical protein
MHQLHIDALTGVHQAQLDYVLLALRKRQNAAVKS